MVNARNDYWLHGGPNSVGVKRLWGIEPWILALQTSFIPLGWRHYHAMVESKFASLSTDVREGLTWFRLFLVARFLQASWKRHVWVNTRTISPSWVARAFAYSAIGPGSIPGRNWAAMLSLIQTTFDASKHKATPILVEYSATGVAETGSHMLHESLLNKIRLR